MYSQLLRDYGRNWGCDFSALKHILKKTIHLLFRHPFSRHTISVEHSATTTNATKTNGTTTTKKNLIFFSF